MGHSKSRISAGIIDPQKFGVSFSLKQCRDFKIDSPKVLQFLIKDVGFRRFRLMSYWDEHEPKQGHYDFSVLDAQIRQIEKANGIITLCLGVRQPRWPESHWPKWALDLPEQERYRRLYQFISMVVDRYKSSKSIVSWQLENEALNRGFGTNGDFNRKRLKIEYELVRTLDPDRPIIMSTSNTWGVPLRKPRPDIFGFTFYQTQFENNRYRRSKLPWWWYNLRAFKIALLIGRKSFIHELQAEPWGPKAIWEMTRKEQVKSMDVEQLQKNITLAKKTALYPIDLWGGEWWYWRNLRHNDPSIWNTVKTSFKDS